MADSSSRGIFGFFSGNKERQRPLSVGTQPPTEPNIKCLVYETGKTLNSHKDYIDRLKEQIPLQKVDTEDACDFILVFCPIVSRAGTDIEAAMKKLQNISETKPAVLVVLHHTFNPEHVVPDSRRIINRKNMITVDCLFYEDQGLLQCSKNNESLSTTSKYIKSQVKELYKNVRKQGEGVKSNLGLRNREKNNEEKDALLEDTNTKPEKMTNEAQESKNVQHENDQQLNPKYTHIQKAQELVEIMEKGNVKLQLEICKEHEQLKDLKNCMEINYAELVKTNEKFQNATEQIKEKDSQLETLGQELKDKKRQLQEMTFVLEQQKAELEKKTKQIQEKDKLLNENKQTLQMKDKTLKKMDTLLREVKEELGKANSTLEENQEQLKVKEQQLENMGNELETSKQKLMEKDKQIQEKDRLLAAQMQIKNETLAQKATQFKQEKEQEEEGANTGIGELPGPNCHLVLESKSQMKEKERELEKEVNMPSQEQEQEEKEQEQTGDNLARGTDN